MRRGWREKGGNKGSVKRKEEGEKERKEIAEEGKRKVGEKVRNRKARERWR